MRKMLVITMALSILLMLNVSPISAVASAPASDTRQSSDFGIMAPACPYCDGQGRLIRSDHYTSWSNTGHYTQCRKDPAYNDPEQVRYYYYVEDCTNCSYVYTSPVSAEYRWYCAH